MTKAKFRKIKSAWSITENTVIALLLATGFTNESLTLLIFKIASSYITNMADLLFGGGTTNAKP